MKLKSLLFGSAAVLAAGTGAQAADLPTAEPVEYVRICDAFGTGFFYIPGTDTCLRIGGRVRIEAHYVDTFDDDDDDDDDGDGGFDFFDDNERERNNFTTRARGNLSLDARTQTDFGLVRAFLGYEMNVGPREFGDYSDTGPTLNEAFIQISNDWGRFTAGHTASFFDIWGSNTFGTRVGIDDNTGEQTLFGYDFTGGSGFRFGVSLEDPASGDRRFDGEVRANDLFFDGDGDGVDDDGLLGFVEAEDNYEGQELPDLVGFIGIEQGWGTARISGMVGHIHDKEEFEGAEGEDDADELRWALSAGGTADFGLFGFSTQFGYTEGALGYLTNDPGGVGDFEGPDGEANSAWMVRAGISAGFTETVTFNLDGSFTDVEDDEGDDDGGVDEDAFDESYQFWAVAANVVWEPVDGLIMGPEVAYNNLEFDGDDDDDDIDLDDDDDDDDDSQDFWKVMFRIQRDF